MLAEAFPIVFGQPVFNGDDRVLFYPGFIQHGQFGARLFSLAGFNEVVLAVAKEGTRGGIKSDGHILARFVTRRRDGFNDQFAGFVVGF